MAQRDWRHRKNDGMNSSFSMLFLFSVAVTLLAWNIRLSFCSCPLYKTLQREVGVKNPFLILLRFLYCISVRKEYAMAT